MYSSDYHVNLYFEAITPDPNSDQIAVRVTSKIQWNEDSKPSLIYKVIEKQYRDMVTEYLQFYGTWVPQKLAEMDKKQHWGVVTTDP